jgi:hypothetical protein
MSFTRRLNPLMIGLCILVVAAVPQRAARADTAPKPTMKFTFEYEISPAPSIVSGIQEECSQADCSDAHPLMGGGPQRFGCSSSACSSLAYSYSKFHRLKVTFSDGITRESNIFGKKFFYASYTVAVRENDLQVDELMGEMKPFFTLEWMLICGGGILIAGILLSFILLLTIAARAREFGESRRVYTIAWIVSVPPMAILLLVSLASPGFLLMISAEMAIAAVYAVWRKLPRALILTVVFMMNLFAVPLYMVIFGGVFFPGRSGATWILGTAFIVWFCKAGLLAFALRKMVRFGEAVLLSLVMNAPTFGMALLSLVLTSLHSK